MSREAAIDVLDCNRVDIGTEWLNSYPTLIRRARRLARGGPQDAEDLVSEAMVKVLNYLRLEREAENFVGLMQVTLLQVHLDGNRRHGNRIFASAAELGEDCGQHEAVPSVERSYIAKETLGDILDYLATMSVEAQRLFHLRFVSDLSYAEIGMITGVTEACARQQVRKLRQKLVQRPQIDGASPSRGALRHVIPNEDRV